MGTATRSGFFPRRRLATVLAAFSLLAFSRSIPCRAGGAALAGQGAVARMELIGESGTEWRIPEDAEQVSVLVVVVGGIGERIGRNDEDQL